MDFTREPIIETVITPKEGCKLVIRSSRGAGQEEFFVDAVEVVSFGQSFFFRSMERPKSFIVPVTDYEILEVRETRMVLKSVHLEKAAKPTSHARSTKEITEKKSSKKAADTSGESSSPAEPKTEKKREKRRSSRRRRLREDKTDEEAAPVLEAELAEIATPEPLLKTEQIVPEKVVPQSFNSILAPPDTLIAETIGRYRDDELYRNAFFNREDEDEQEESSEPAFSGAAPEIPPAEVEFADDADTATEEVETSDDVKAETNVVAEEDAGSKPDFFLGSNEEESKPSYPDFPPLAGGDSFKEEEAVVEPTAEPEPAALSESSDDSNGERKDEGTTIGT